MPSIQAAFDRVSSGAVDGRATYPRFKQEQLGILFNILSSSSQAFVSALAEDTGRTAFELELELALVIRHVDALVKGCDFHTLKKAENADLAAGFLVKPVGTVLIVGGVEAPMDSWVSPFATAIASGNTALILLPNCPKFAELLRSPLQDLNRGAYQFHLATSDNIKAALALSAPHTFITATSPSVRSQASHLAKPLSLLPSQLGSTPIIVTSSNTTALPLLANQIVRAANKVSYVLVHEEIVAALTDAVRLAAQNTFGSDPALSSDVRKMAKEDVESVRGILETEVKKGGAQVVYGGTSGSTILPTVIAKVKSDSPLLHNLAAPLIPIVSTSSLEDAIAIVNHGGVGSTVYAFGNAQDLNYLADNISVTSFYFNDVPLESLVGEANVSRNNAIRYPTSLFQKTIELLHPQSSSISQLYGPFTLTAFKKIQLLRGSSKVKRVDRQTHTPILRRSFFPQGLFLVAGSILSVVLGGSGWAVYLLSRWWLNRSQI